MARKDVHEISDHLLRDLPVEQIRTCYSTIMPKCFASGSICDDAA